MDAEKLAWFIQSYMQSSESDDPTMSNYVESQEYTSIRAVRMDGEFDLYSLAEAIQEYLEQEDED